ncbi:MAG: hypothetical protein JNK63_05140 [Chthonomonas sp.]|nr:hypothetical protein [Chthonomonas sp.]
MQIPELNLFWLLVGAFVAAGATWAIDAILIKRSINGGDSEALAALHEKARQVEPLNQKLRNANAQIDELNTKLLRADSSAQDEAHAAQTADLEGQLAAALAAEEEASRLAQSLKQELGAKDAEIGTLSSGHSDLIQQLQQHQVSLAELQVQSAESNALKQALAELKSRFEELQTTAPSEAEVANVRLRAEHAETELERLRFEFENSSHVTRVAELEAQNAALQQQLSSKDQAVVQEFEQERDGLLASISKLQSQLIESDEVVENFRSQLAHANAMLAEHASEPEQIQNLESQLADRNAEIERLSHRVPELESLVAQLHHELGQKSAAINEYESNSEIQELRATVARLNNELESLRLSTTQDRAMLVQAQAEAELLREAKPVASMPTEVSTLEERMNDLFGAVQASHREAAENRRALQEAMEQIRLLQDAVGSTAPTKEARRPAKSDSRKKVAGGGSVRDELTESSELGELS